MHQTAGILPSVNVCYRAWQDADVIESWTEISHQEKKQVVLNQFASGYLPIRRGDVWLSHLSGSWANEGVLKPEPLTPVSYTHLGGVI